jgi:CDP-diacylglycerol--glycerol-3-phosphate 3-phosphatidyltransferase
MIDNAFRAILPRFVRPVLSLYGHLGWTPNQVTVLALVIALFASAAVAFHFWWLAFVLWWLSRLADGTDGLYARESGQASDFGAYFDMVLDMAAYGSMVLGFAIAAPEFQTQWMAMLFLYILCIASALSLGMQEAKRAIEPRDNRGLRLGAGLAEGGETGIAYSIFLLLPGLLGISTTIWVGILIITVIARSVLAYKILRPEQPAGSRTTQPFESSEV